MNQLKDASIQQLARMFRDAVEMQDGKMIKAIIQEFYRRSKYDE